MNKNKDKDKSELKLELQKLKESNAKILNQIENMLTVLEDIQSIINKLKKN